MENCSSSLLLQVPIHFTCWHDCQDDYSQMLKTILLRFFPEPRLKIRQPWDSSSARSYFPMTALCLVARIISIDFSLCVPCIRVFCAWWCTDHFTFHFLLLSTSLFVIPVVHSILSSPKEPHFKCCQFFNGSFCEQPGFHTIQ